MILHFAGEVLFWRWSPAFVWDWNSSLKEPS